MPVCSLNPSRSHYIDVSDWKRIVDGERGRKLEEYWRGLAVEVQEKLAIDGCVRQILRELRLGRLGATSRFAAGLVQLRGMASRTCERCGRCSTRTKGTLKGLPKHWLPHDVLTCVRYVAIILYCSMIV